ncbi:hypothetical protein P4I21_25510, partial [Escherichia coli]
LPSETMIWQPEFTDKTLSRKPGAVQYGYRDSCDDPAYDVLPSWSSTTNTAWIILAVKPDNFWLVDSPEMDVGTIRY